jgi:serine/threonine-protein kinase
MSGGGIEPGAEVAGFVIEAIAGRGGMGVVYRARQRQPDRTVALKVIAPELAGGPEFRARFERECAIAAQIEHPNVIPVYAVGEDDGLLYIAMRFIEGTDLRSVIADEGRLEPRRAAVLVDQIAQALDAAHAHGLVHRDVKPANCLIARPGGREHVYLTDFGLARPAVASSGQTLTAPGEFLGTVDYVAPEQARGEQGDARTDVYALGCVLYELLTGNPPFDGSLPELMNKHCDQRPARPSWLRGGIPLEVERLVLRALAKAPELRPTMAELALAFADLADVALASETMRMAV